MNLDIDIEKKILIADDDENTLLLLHDLLEKSAQVFEAMSASEALTIFQQQKNIDLVILDLKLPDMDGVGLLAQMREINPELPSIAISALTPDIAEALCKSEGFNAFLSKPFNLTKIKSLVEYHLYAMSENQ